MKYIHVTNWSKYQRFGDRRVKWVKVHVKLHREDSFLDLTGHQRAVLLGIWIEYGLNVRQDALNQFSDARGIILNTSSLSRRLNLRVMTRDVESLNQAGFIWFSEHEARQDATPTESLDTQILRDLDNPLDADASESESDELEQGENEARSEARSDREIAVDGLLPRGQSRRPAPARADDDADADIVLPSKPLLNGRPRDEVWDELERLFGVVEPANKSAHKNRNRVSAELTAIGATAELIRLAARRWSSLYPSATLTDSAMAKHWPQLTAGARKSTGLPACPECGMGGGLHVADCPTVAARPPGDLERFLDDEASDEEVA